jgi:hypothetical protein
MARGKQVPEEVNAGGEGAGRAQAEQDAPPTASEEPPEDGEGAEQSRSAQQAIRDAIEACREDELQDSDEEDEEEEDEEEEEDDDEVGWKAGLRCQPVPC